MDQLAAPAFSAKRRPHIKSFHLACLGVDSSQRAASCDLASLVIERQKQASPRTRIFAGKLCQFLRESVEAKTNSHRFGIFNEKLACYANELRRFGLFDAHDDVPPLFVMLSNSPRNLNA